MMNNNAGCLICEKELTYSQIPEPLECVVCGRTFQETVKCSNGHFICNQCHIGGATDLIANFCCNSTMTNPIAMAQILMRHPQVKMHGPEHHFLVPAVLLASFYNLKGESNLKRIKIGLAQQRSQKVPGGFCGSHGNCGAGVGTGIFFSIITETTPLSGKTWQLSNLLTGGCLVEIARKGGPRCCKRDTYTAISHAVNFVKENLNITLPVSDEIICEFHSRNRQCLYTNCEYYRANP